MDFSFSEEQTLLQDIELAALAHDRAQPTALNVTAPIIRAAYPLLEDIDVLRELLFDVLSPAFSAADVRELSRRVGATPRGIAQ